MLDHRVTFDLAFDTHKAFSEGYLTMYRERTKSLLINHGGLVYSLVALAYIMVVSWAGFRPGKR